MRTLISAPCGRRGQPLTVSAVLALEDGSVFEAFRSVPRKYHRRSCLNTSISGYQEILTDPSYCRQIVTLTHPHIGNVGANPEDLESCRDLRGGTRGTRPAAALASSWRSAESLSELPAAWQARRDRRDRYAQAHAHVCATKCAQSGCIMTGDIIDETAAVHAARKFPD